MTLCAVLWQRHEIQLRLHSPQEVLRFNNKTETRCAIPSPSQFTLWRLGAVVSVLQNESLLGYVNCSCTKEPLCAAKLKLGGKITAVGSQAINPLKLLALVR